MMKPIRKMIGSRSKYWARPPATPATLRSVRLRSRRRACGALCDVVSVMGRACLGAGPVPIRNLPGPTLQSTPLMSEKLITDNRRARHDYHLLERHEAGMVLTGTEVKSLRQGRVTLGNAYADVRDGELWLIGAHIDEYDQGNLANHEPERDRKLLMKRHEIDSLYSKVREKGLTLVPTRLYFKDGKVKVEIAVARGKELRDKRRDLVQRDQQREMERALTSRR